MKNELRNQRWVILTIVLMLLSCYVTRGQFWDCSTGLLQTPSANMNRDGTFMITNILLIDIRFLLSIGDIIHSNMGLM